MEFDPRWLLFVLPVVFVLGWLASKLDSRQWKLEQRESPKAYFKGLNLLLNEQQDKAIDAFIEAVQNDPDTSELHFALGSLFRRRGETERAVRVHEHLLRRGDLSKADRARAQHELAQDFFKAGLFDRAENAYAVLRGTAFEREARLALLSLYERSRDWAKAADIAAELESAGTGSFSNRIAHYLCEQALVAQSQGHADLALDLLAQAQRRAPEAARAYVLQGQMLLKAGQPEGALLVFSKLLAANPPAFNLVAADCAAAAKALGQPDRGIDLLSAQYQREPSLALLRALAGLQPEPQRARLAAHLRDQPALSAAADLLKLNAAALPPEEATPIIQALDKAAKPLQRYRCAACGFEAAHYFWQCPGCLNWDSYPPQPIEELS
ncbi:MAG: lipopolysaccharide assembly protein LapB [Roseateles sp.]|jgi:lipopolysaccharide biosynthesis regulator YciM|nr:lipopolysaccharide assembly protein LapB [Methylibium sp.]MBY0367966.1 lipopolysaccharide assembly protein LapB [Burkholderiaceae bacterium]|mmetsp:Transcript_70461/g.166093  ORF Transcript_70461/g.166093 Transcript_70461/m.166093 type:complete len:382 (+) Transcript_70461:324-1469(+)